MVHFLLLLSAIACNLVRGTMGNADVSFLSFQVTNYIQKSLLYKTEFVTINEVA